MHKLEHRINFSENVPKDSPQQAKDKSTRFKRKFFSYIHKNVKETNMQHKHNKWGTV